MHYGRLIPLLALVLAACSNPTMPCLADENEFARVVEVKESYLKLRMKNGTTRICYVDEERAAMLKPNDILQGPLDDIYWWSPAR